MKHFRNGGVIVTREVRIDQKAVGKVLGKKGETIHRLRAQHACEIKLDQSTQSEGYSVATIYGNSEEQVGGAADEISLIALEYLQLLEDQKQNEVVINIPQKFVGLIIGNKGITIQKIKNEAGCEISMNQDTKELGYSCCKVSGSLEAVKKAENIINLMIQSGQSASDQFEENRKQIAAGMQPAPFTLDRIKGLEFLEEGEGGTPK